MYAASLQEGENLAQFLLQKGADPNAKSMCAFQMNGYENAKSMQR